jgi:hydrogenase maturation protein HypF
MARILAFGAFLKNAACLLDTDAPDAPRWSSVHGDLSDPASCVALSESIQALLGEVNHRIDAVAHDLHPDFFSTHLALQVAQEHQVEAIAVQHHHAHIAAVMAEHGLNHPVLGLALDGVGLGTDDLAWGGEVLLVDGEHFERVGHLLPLALPGGDVAAREPWRMAAAAMHACGKTDQIVPRFDPVVGEQAARTITTMLQRALNCPTSTAAGRWFDAAAGLLGLSFRQEVEAQAAMALEQAAARWLQIHTMETRPGDGNITEDGQIDLRPLFVSWLGKDQPSEPSKVDEAAARFHLTLADVLANHTASVAKTRGVRDVALGGGCFFNHILKQRISAQLGAEGLNVWAAQTIPCGDAGLALGQAWVAARRLQCVRIAPSDQEPSLCV